MSFAKASLLTKNLSIYIYTLYTHILDRKTATLLFHDWIPLLKFARAPILSVNCKAAMIFQWDLRGRYSSNFARVSEAELQSCNDISMGAWGQIL